jgi:hypothetical protein
MNTSQIAAVHNDIGLLLFLKGDYYESCIHHDKAVTLLNENHPLLHEYEGNLSLAKNMCDHLKKHKKIRKGVVLSAFPFLRTRTPAQI